MEFEIKNEGFYYVEEESFESDDEVELQTLSLRMSDHLRTSIERYNPPNFCSTFVLSTINDEPRYVKEEASSEECKLWNKAMVEKTKALDKNEPWDLVEFFDGRKPIGSKWVFKKKLNIAGKFEKYKA